MGVYGTKQVIVMRKDLNMRKGKMIAQGAHAALGIFAQEMEIQDNNIAEVSLWPEAIEWLTGSYAKVCVGVDSKQELLDIYEAAKALELPRILIHDNGTTEFGGVTTVTCCAIGPHKYDLIDQVTGHLKLL